VSSFGVKVIFLRPNIFQFDDTYIRDHPIGDFINYDSQICHVKLEDFMLQPALLERLRIRFGFT
jgi:hypothetical protein